MFEDIDKRLEELRIEWRARPMKRDIIERQARALQIAREIRERRTAQQRLIY